MTENKKEKARYNENINLLKEIPGTSLLACTPFMQEKNARLNEFSNLGLLDGEGIFSWIVVCAVVGGVEVRHHSHLHLVLPRRREVVREARLKRNDKKIIGWYKFYKYAKK